MVVTNEDPYTEDPEKIIDEVLSGITDQPIIRGRDNYRPSMAESLCAYFRSSGGHTFSAVPCFQAGDIVLFSGKGGDITMMTRSRSDSRMRRQLSKENCEMPDSSRVCEKLLALCPRLIATHSTMPLAIIGNVQLPVARRQVRSGSRRAGRGISHHKTQTAVHRQNKAVVMP